ncbi:MAG: hypothetical protein AB7K09_21870 [Planctomycetota bacterium]
MAENYVQCPNCMAQVAVPILEVGMVLNCPMCHTGSRITRDAVDRIKRGERVVSERLPAIADMPALGEVQPGSEMDGDYLADDDSLPGPALPKLATGEGGTKIHAAGLSPAQLAAARRKETMRGGTEFRSRIIGDYRHEKLARLAVDVGNVGRTRGYIAMVLLLCGALLPASVLTRPAKEGIAPMSTLVLAWEFNNPKVTVADFYEEIPAEMAEMQLPRTGPSGYVFLVGMVLIAVLAVVAARFARFKRRPWYYLLLALAAIVVWQFNPFSGSRWQFSTIRLYDPYMRGLDTLMMVSVGIQLGMMTVLRYFPDMRLARGLVVFNTLLLLGLFLFIAFNGLSDRTNDPLIASVADLFAPKHGMPVKASMVCALMAGLLIFPMIQIASPALTTNAMVSLFTYTLLLMLPLGIVLGSAGDYDLPSVMRTWLGIYGPLFLIGGGVAELLINKLLMMKVNMELENPKDWWAPAFQRMRLDARYAARLVPDDEYRREYKRLTELMGPQGFM